MEREFLCLVLKSSKLNRSRGIEYVAVYDKAGNNVWGIAAHFKDLCAFDRLINSTIDLLIAGLLDENRAIDLSNPKERKPLIGTYTLYCCREH